MIEKATPYMIRNDGKVFCCKPLHPYIKYVHEDLQDAVKRLCQDSSLSWFYNNTLKETTKNLIEVVYNYLLHNNQIKELDIEIDDETYLPTQQEVDGFLEVLNADTNQEFLRMRTSSLLYGGSSKDIFFRISSIDFNWFPVIWNVVSDNKNFISTITVCKDSNTFGNPFQAYKVKDIALKNILVEEFLTLQGNPIVEAKSSFPVIKESYNKLLTGNSISESYSYLHPVYVLGFYRNQIKEHLEHNIEYILYNNL